jgi:two-component system, chemotaxis family, response regulator Rcp1
MMVPGTKLQPVEILLVEDNPVDVMMTKEVFSSGRICNNLYVVEDGEEAMDFLYKRGQYSSAPLPDVILLDLNLPKKDGREVLADVKKDPSLSHIPIIILTTSEDQDDILNSYEQRANCFITKPVDMEQFTRVLECVGDFWFAVVQLPRQ